MKVLQQHQAAERRAWHETGLAHGKPPGVGDVEAVHILVRRNCRDHCLFVEVRGEGKLDEYAIDGRIGIEPFDQRQQLVSWGIRGQAMLEARHACGHGRLVLGADIDLARRVFADQHDREPGLAPGARFERCGMACNTLAQLAGERFSVNQGHRHQAPYATE